MYLSKLNKTFSELDRKIVYYIIQIQNQMEAQAREHALLTCKYKLGFKFIHPKHGMCVIRDLKIRLNKKDFMSFDNNTLLLDEDYYNPYYLYLIDSIETENVKGLVLNESDIEEFVNG